MERLLRPSSWSRARVQLDSDWNEWLAEISRRTRAGTLDLVGRAAYPPTTPFAFQITASVTGTTNSLSIGRGRMYVDGLLAENHGDPAAAAWDPALAELSGSPQPPPATDPDPLDFTAQPYAARRHGTDRHRCATWRTSTCGRARSPGSRTPTSWTRR